MKKSLAHVLAATTVFAAAAGVVGGTAPSASATTATSTCSTASILGVNSSSGELTRWSDATPQAIGGFSTTVVAPTWTNARLLASDAATGRLFAVFNDGTMRQYTYSNGKYVSGTQIGTGWGNVTNLLPMGDGVFYATFADGTMRYYRVVNGDFTADSGDDLIGTGWNNMSAVASGGNGIVYAVNKTDNKLYWYKKANPASPTRSWSAPKIVGSGWGGYTRLLGAGDGIIYGVTDAGVMSWFNHTTAQTGEFTWAAGSATQMGPGWQNFKALTVNPNACKPGSTSSRGAQIVSAAAAEVGTLEGSAANKYLSWNWSGLSTSTTAWCAGFVSYITNHKLGVTTLANLWVPDWVTYASQGKYGLSRVSTPAPGDLVAFDWDKNGEWNHIGIVESVNGSTITTIEGNTGPNSGSGSDGVFRKTRYTTSSSYSLAFMRLS